MPTPFMPDPPNPYTPTGPHLPSDPITQYGPTGLAGDIPGMTFPPLAKQASGPAATEPAPGQRMIDTITLPDGRTLTTIMEWVPADRYGPGGWIPVDPDLAIIGKGPDEAGTDAVGWANLAQRKYEFEQTLELQKQQLLDSKAQTLIQGFNALINLGKLTDEQAINKFNAEMTEYGKLIDNINETYTKSFESWQAQETSNYNRQVAEQTRQAGLMSEATTRGRDVAQNILPSLIGATPFNAEKYYNSMGIPAPNPQAIPQDPFAPPPAIPTLPAVPTGGYQPTPAPSFDIEDLRRKLGLV